MSKCKIVLIGIWPGPHKKCIKLRRMLLRDSKIWVLLHVPCSDEKNTECMTGKTGQVYQVQN